MSIPSLEFLVVLLAVSTFFFHVSRVVRLTLLAAANGVVLWLLIPNAASWAFLAAFLLSGYGIGLLLRAWPRRWVLVVYLVLLIGVFLVVQGYEFVVPLVPAGVLAYPASIVGLSYMLFRQIHFLVDSMQGQIQHPSLWIYLNYQGNLFTLLAGPIQRYQAFREYWEKPAPRWKDGHELRKLHLRVLRGVVKILGFAALCHFAYEKLSDRLLALHAGGTGPGAIVTVLLFLAIFYLYPAYVYLNFSGYCDVVIGGAALLGQELPENFDRPYLARNMIDFWNRWHRTLTLWIRDYLFTPMYKAMVTRAPGRANSIVFLCYFISLFIAGLWHGSTWNFVIFGFLQGIAVSAAKLWENHIIKQRGRKGLKLYMKSRPIEVVAIVANFHFACFTLTFFPEDLERTGRIYAALLRSLT